MTGTTNRSEATTQTPAVTTSGLTRRFGRVMALNDVHFEVPTGTVLGLLGPNGSGKTTLLSILAGFISPTSGSYSLLGESDHRRALARTGSLISRPLLWPHLSCRDNLRCVHGMLGFPRSGDGVERELAEVGLDGNAADRKFGQCSTGMKQRLGIAAALLGDPELLLLDEPTTGLDPEGMVEIRELIRDLGKRSGRTIIMSSHLLNEVELTCDHFAIIFRGQLADQGRLNERHDLSRPGTGASGSNTATEMQTTDNRLALSCLLEQGWQAVLRPGQNDAAPALVVETSQGEEWKVAQELATRGIYPSAMRQTTAAAPSGGLEQRYLAAVGRIDSPPFEDAP